MHAPRGPLTGEYKIMVLSCLQERDPSNISCYKDYVTTLSFYEGWKIGSFPLHADI